VAVTAVAMVAVVAKAVAATAAVTDSRLRLSEHSAAES
jgi:hypothetical protein